MLFVRKHERTIVECPIGGVLERDCGVTQCPAMSLDLAVLFRVSAPANGSPSKGFFDTRRVHRIVIPVGNTLSVRRLDDRAFGAFVAAALGILLVVAASLMLVPTRGGAAPLVLIAVLSLLVAVPLGWLFAPRALAPGTRSALGAAAGITAVAVPIGALLIGLGMVVGRSDLTLGDTLAGLLFVVVAGLVLFGLPLGCLTFAVAGVWVGLVRVLNKRGSSS